MKTILFDINNEGLWTLFYGYFIFIFRVPAIQKYGIKYPALFLVAIFYFIFLRITVTYTNSSDKKYLVTRIISVNFG